MFKNATLYFYIYLLMDISRLLLTVKNDVFFSLKKVISSYFKFILN